MKYFVTGIDTGVGKTVVSAVLTEALGATYFKPIQAGNLDHTDRDTVESLVSHPRSRFLEERWRLKEPMSPHAAARIDGVHITLESLRPEPLEGSLIIEGAGGVMVPINDDQLFVDAAPLFDAEMVLVIKNYLGSINHSLLSIEALENRGLPIAGVVINGAENVESESVILRRSGLPVVARVPEADTLTPEFITSCAREVTLP